MLILQRLKAYLTYRFGSVNKFGIHSPFVYRFVTEILEAKTPHAEYVLPERIRKQLLQDCRKIRIGNTSVGGPEEEMEVREIVRKHGAGKRDGRMLFRVVKEMQPATIVELGTSVGISTAYMASACRGSEIHTVECRDEVAAVANEVIGAAGLMNVRILTGRFDEVLPGLLEKISGPDLVFIDGDHSKEPLLRYFGMLLPHVHNDTVMIVHDIHWSSEMEQAWKTIIANDRVRVSLDLYSTGILFFKKELSRQGFIIRYA